MDILAFIGQKLKLKTPAKIFTKTVQQAIPFWDVGKLFRSFYHILLI